MEVLTTVQELKHDTLDGCRWDGVSRGLRVVVYNLKQVMLGILKHHENTFILQDDLHQPDDIHMTKFGTEGHFPDGGLRDSSVLDLLAFLVCNLSSALALPSEERRLW